jgi:hypothetical protein
MLAASPRRVRAADSQKPAGGAAPAASGGHGASGSAAATASRRGSLAPARERGEPTRRRDDGGVHPSSSASYLSNHLSAIDRRGPLRGERAAGRGRSLHRNPMGTCVRAMTSQGSPYTIFRRALERRSLTGVRAAVANLPRPPPLDDALAICLLLLEQEPDRFERGAVRWLGRLLLEQPGIGLRHAELAAVYLSALADPARHDAATEALGELGRAVGLRRLGERIARPGDG